MVVRMAKENMAAPNILIFVGSGLAEMFCLISLALAEVANVELVSPLPPRIRADEAIIAHNQMAFILFMYVIFSLRFFVGVRMGV